MKIAYKEIIKSRLKGGGKKYDYPQIKKFIIDKIELAIKNTD